jgi:hypothetical protein
MELLHVQVEYGSQLFAGLQRLDPMEKEDRALVSQKLVVELETLPCLVPDALVLVLDRPHEEDVDEV